VSADTKTTRAVSLDRSDDELVRLHRTSPQFLGHSALVLHHFGELPHIMINWIGKERAPRMRRLTFQHTLAEVVLWVENAARTRRLKLVQRAVDAGVANYAACSPGIGDPCWALDFCHTSASLDELEETLRISSKGIEARERIHAQVRNLPSHQE